MQTAALMLCTRRITHLYRGRAADAFLSGLALSAAEAYQASRPPYLSVGLAVAKNPPHISSSTALPTSLHRSAVKLAEANPSMKPMRAAMGGKGVDVVDDES